MSCEQCGQGLSWTSRKNPEIERRLAELARLQALVEQRRQTLHNRISSNSNNDNNNVIEHDMEKREIREKEDLIEKVDQRINKSNLILLLIYYLHFTDMFIICLVGLRVLEETIMLNKSESQLQAIRQTRENLTLDSDNLVKINSLLTTHLTESRQVIYVIIHKNIAEIFSIMLICLYFMCDIRLYIFFASRPVWTSFACFNYISHHCIKTLR